MWTLCLYAVFYTVTGVFALTIVLIIVTIGIVLYGYLLMHRIDRFFDKQPLGETPLDFSQKDVLLFGNPEDLKTLCQQLGMVGLSFDCVDEPKLCAHTVYRFVGAFSRSDIDNLQLCTSAKRDQKGIRILTKCNDPIYENIYKHIGASLVLRKDVECIQIFSFIEGQEHVYHRES